jgi:hypothetical protein
MTELQSAEKRGLQVRKWLQSGPNPSLLRIGESCKSDCHKNGASRTLFDE